MKESKRISEQNSVDTSLNLKKDKLYSVNNRNQQDVIKIDYFTSNIKRENKRTYKEPIQEEKRVIHKDEYYKQLNEYLEDIQKLALELKLAHLYPELKRIHNSLKNTKFTISVVGEFSRGKSTIINKLLNHNVLPVGDLPTTAMLTKVSYNEKPLIVHISKDGSKKTYPLQPNTWKNLVTNNHKDPQGLIYVGLKQDWLKENNIQMIDTPGAGDLNDKRVELVNDALVCSDGVIIAVSALAALSQTEKFFIEQRILTKKIPHVMLVVTRLDQVNVKHRASVIKFIKDKLNLWHYDIPVYIIQDNIEILTDVYNEVIGTRNIRSEIDSWIRDEEHTHLWATSICAQMLNILEIISHSLEDKKELITLSDEEKDNALKKKKEQIENIRLKWEDYRIEMLRRSTLCSEALQSKITEKQKDVIERLKYMILHTNNPKTWWENEYQYRLKLELTNLATFLENELSRIFVNDVKWLNDKLSREFKKSVLIKKETISDKEQFNADNQTQIDIKDINKMKMFTRIGAGAVTVLGYVCLGPLGIAASIGGGIVSELLLGKDIEKQKNVLNELLEKDISNIIREATHLIEQRVTGIYDNVLEEASNQEELWLKTQYDILNKASHSDNKDQKVLNNIANRVKDINEKIKKTMED